MNLIQDTENDWTVCGTNRAVYIHKNEDGTFTNSIKEGPGHKGGLVTAIGSYLTLEEAYTAAISQ